MMLLPDSWVETSFTNVFDIQGGTQPPKSTFIYEAKDGYIQLLQIRDFGERPVPTFIPDTRNLKKCEDEDILIARYGASLGRILTGLSGAYNVAMAKVIIPPELNRRYVFHLLNSEQFQSPLKLVSRSAQNGFNKDDLAEFHLSIAPQNEQKRIADKLDAVLALVDACRDRLDRIPAILKRFRQSVLAAATSGKLTEDWRKEHLEHQIQMQPFTESESRSLAWQEGTLANLLIGKPRNGYSPRAVEYKTAVKSLTLTATTSGRFKAEHFKYIDEDISQESHLWLNPGDILIQRANTLESVGVSAIYDGPPLTFIYPDLMMKAKANELVETKFLHYLLLSEPVRRHFRDNATGTAGNMPKINQPTVLSAPVSWPLHVEQTEIIRRVESLFAYSDRLEVRYHAARNQVEKLTPSLLAKAFRGELVPQDPKDEPVSELLARIAESKTAEQPKKRAGKRQTKPS